MAWVPRDRETLPGLTTNAEWGVWQDSGKIVFGAPKGAWKTRYLRHYAKKLGVPAATTLFDTVKATVDYIGDGAPRMNGEREIPLFIWRTPHFQQWYKSLLLAGNVLEHARVVWTFRVGPQRDFVFFWALHAEVYITAEKRSKTNEVVMARPDIATIVLYKKEEDIDDSQIVLVREFRTPVSNPTGYVWEPPGGSSFKPIDDPRTLASHESQEETGLKIDPERFQYYGARQLVATLGSHKAHVFAAEITDEELDWLRTQNNLSQQLCWLFLITFRFSYPLIQARWGSFLVQMHYPNEQVDFPKEVMSVDQLWCYPVGCLLHRIVDVWFDPELGERGCDVVLDDADDLGGTSVREELVVEDEDRTFRRQDGILPDLEHRRRTKHLLHHRTQI